MAPRKGKYAGIVNTLPKAPIVAPERRDVIEALKMEIMAPPSQNDLKLPPNAVEQLVDEIETAASLLFQVEKRATAGKVRAAEFARVYAELRGIKSKFDEWESTLNLLIDTYQALMLAQMEDEGLTSLRLDNGQPITTWEEPYATLVDEQAFHAWCLADPDLRRKMQLHAGTRNMITKERLLAGEPEPPGVSVSVVKKVRLGRG